MTHVLLTLALLVTGPAKAPANPAPKHPHTKAKKHDVHPSDASPFVLFGTASGDDWVYLRVAEVGREYQKYKSAIDNRLFLDFAKASQKLMDEDVKAPTRTQDETTFWSARFALLDAEDIASKYHRS